MREAAWVIALLFIVTLLTVVAKRVSIPYPTFMVCAGGLISFLPGLPRVVITPDLVLLIFLPPLLYAAAWGIPWHEFRANFRPIGFLAVGLPLATTAAVAWVSRQVVPDLSWPMAAVLGALVSPPDAIAATTIMRTVRVPRRIVTILEGESLVNDATALVSYRLAVAAALTGAFSWRTAGLQFIWVTVTGVGLGLLVGKAVSWAHRRLDDANIETSITLLTPFAAYLLAEVVHGSGVLATVTAGLYLRRLAPVILTSTSRLQASAVWDLVVFLLNGLVFVLIGLELREIVGSIRGDSLWPVIQWALWILLTVIVVRLLWVFLSAYLFRLVVPGLRERDPVPSWKVLAVVGWAGMRGVVSLAAALALPVGDGTSPSFHYREYVIFLTFCVILGTLFLQSLSLPWLIRKFGISTPRSLADEEADARLLVLRAAVRFLEQQARRDRGCLPEMEHVRRQFEIRASHALARISEENPDFHLPIAACQDLHAGAMRAQREQLESLRQSGDFDGHVLDRLEREIDLEETQMQSHSYSR